MKVPAHHVHLCGNTHSATRWMFSGKAVLLITQA